MKKNTNAVNGTQINKKERELDLKDILFDNSISIKENKPSRKKDKTDNLDRFYYNYVTENDVNVLKALRNTPYAVKKEGINNSSIELLKDKSTTSLYEDAVMLTLKKRDVPYDDIIDIFKSGIDKNLEEKSYCSLTTRYGRIRRGRLSFKKTGFYELMMADTASIEDVLNAVTYIEKTELNKSSKPISETKRACSKSADYSVSENVPETVNIEVPEENNDNYGYDYTEDESHKEYLRSIRDIEREKVLNLADAIDDKKIQEAMLSALVGPDKHTATDLLILLKENGRSVNTGVTLETRHIAALWKCSYKEVNGFISRLIDKGMPLRRENGYVYLTGTKYVDDTDAGIIKITDPAGDENMIKLGIISDTHYGSKECAEDKIQLFYDIASQLGVRTFLHAGDWLDGNDVYKGQKNALKVLGFSDQVDHAALFYPKIKGCTTYGIMGNHDESFIKTNGANPLDALCVKRHDIVQVGAYQAWLDINGFHVHLQHASRGASKMNPESTLRTLVTAKNLFGFDSRGNFDGHMDLCVVGHYHSDANISTPNVGLAMLGGGFQYPTNLVRQCSLNPYLGGYIVTLTRIKGCNVNAAFNRVSFKPYRNSDSSGYINADLLRRTA